MFWRGQGLRPHPDKIAETNSLSSVPLPKLPYKMSLPGHVLLGALLSPYMLPSLAYLCPCRDSCTAPCHYESTGLGQQDLSVEMRGWCYMTCLRSALTYSRCPYGHVAVALRTLPD